MKAEEALARLCEHCGIASEYADFWGESRRVPQATRLALLAAMGVLHCEEESPTALERFEDGLWRQALPPVAVFREEQTPYLIPFTVPAARARARHQWTLTREDGKTLQGGIVPSTLERAAERELEGTRIIRCRFLWKEPLPLGYHRFSVEGAGAPETMTIIVAPAKCYVPDALRDHGRVWGPALQLYAVRSGRNWGIGDFTDLRNVIEITARAGGGIVGVNPLHALFVHNPAQASPYSPSSRLFLNALYLDVEAIAEFSECTAARERFEDTEFQSRLRALRAAELVDYPGVATLKLEILELLFQHFRTRHLLAQTERGRAFKALINDHDADLDAEALFNALQEHFHRQDPGVWGWPVWPEAYRSPTSSSVQAFNDTQRERVEFFAYLQWNCALQLQACADRCRELGLGVGLYQDLAVGVDRAGADTWRWQRVFSETASIGCPPDAVNLLGQEWGLPPFIPHRLREAAYAPIIAVLSANMRHGGALRIDHVMALQRLFWVPAGGGGADGTYVHYPFDDLLGIVALESHRNRCAVVGEDLGVVPPEVRAALEAHGILSTRILYFEMAEDGRFKLPADYPSQAVVTISTHDLPTLKGYWLGHDLDVRAALHLFPSEEERAEQVVARARDRARLLVALEREHLLPPGIGVHPVSAPDMTTELMSSVQALLARSPATVMTVQIEDVFGQLDQVNLPGTTPERYPNWQRKLPLNLEEWNADLRFRALTDTLHRERGAAITPRVAEAQAPAVKPVIPLAT